jgi:tRNA nucleotidyltransferase/poly(A) polymerase
MRFNEYYFKESINWQEYVKDNEELKYALEIMKKLEDAGYESLLVGGFVRDLLMGKPSSDIDITTNATPNEVEKVFGRVIDIGKNKSMGVSVVPYKGFQYEIATYRTDAYDDLNKGKGADAVQLVKSFKDDAARRDFRINSLGINYKGEVIDHHGGLKDIENKVISSVGDPDLRFKEDEVRSLRGVRFASRFDFNISPETIEAMKKHAPEIAKVSSERINKELRKMASGTGKQFARAIEIMDEVGLLKYILPEIAKMHDFKHSEIHHPEGKRDKDGDPTVFGHTIEALKTQPLKDDIINLSVLFHDLGKIETHSIDDEGFHRYLGHAMEADHIIDDIAKRLKFDNDTKKKIQFAAINHMKMHDLLKMSNNKIAQLMDNDAFDILVKVAEADAKARGKLFDKQGWQKIIDKIDEIAERFQDHKAIESIKKIVNGNLVMQLRNLKGGPEVGRIINKTVEWILDNGIDLNDTKEIENFIMNA